VSKPETYQPPRGLSVPVVTILNRRGEVLEDGQRQAIRFALQDGLGADIIFAAGTNGEWDRIDLQSQQLVARIAVDECRRSASKDHPVEAWVGITTHTRAGTLENLAHAIDLGADAAVVAPLSITDVDDVVDFVVRDIGQIFAGHGRSLPVFLYDNADIAAPGKAPHLHTRDVKRLSQLDYVHGIKVTATKKVLGNYTQAASHFKRSGEFAVYAGNAHLIFELFEPPIGLAGTLRDYWNRYWTRNALPAGLVAGPANVMPREWQRAWQVCEQRQGALMQRYAAVFERFRAACSFTRAGRPVRLTIACLKAALAERGVISDASVAPGTPALEDSEREEFKRRLDELARFAQSTLETAYLSHNPAPDILDRTIKHA
jgi:dihydrodipicolinate synthase/N-acetylneuraminate lyase